MLIPDSSDLVAARNYLTEYITLCSACGKFVHSNNLNLEMRVIANVSYSLLLLSGDSHCAPGHITTEPDAKPSMKVLQEKFAEEIKCYVDFIETKRSIRRYIQE